MHSSWPRRGTTEQERGGPLGEAVAAPLRKAVGSTLSSTRSKPSHFGARSGLSCVLGKTLREKLMGTRGVSAGGFDGVTTPAGGGSVESIPSPRGVEATDRRCYHPCGGWERRIYTTPAGGGSVRERHLGNVAIASQQGRLGGQRRGSLKKGQPMMKRDATRTPTTRGR